MTTRITRAKLAARLDKKPGTLAHWAVKGVGPKFLVIHGRVLYDLDEVERWEREHTHASTAEFDTGARAVSVAAAAAIAHERRAERRAQASA